MDERAAYASGSNMFPYCAILKTICTDHNDNSLKLFKQPNCVRNLKISSGIHPAYNFRILQQTVNGKQLPAASCQRSLTTTVPPGPPPPAPSSTPNAGPC
ncbi:hypothetical protein J6590_044761 [Homalodisca vitripennis]|nr:hypothetical protein J6590_044761 [Homalodisca vitripennis]